MFKSFTKIDDVSKITIFQGSNIPNRDDSMRSTSRKNILKMYNDIARDQISSSVYSFGGKGSVLNTFGREVNLTRSRGEDNLTRPCSVNFVDNSLEFDFRH